MLVEIDFWIHERLDPSVLVALLTDIEAGAYAVEDLHPSDYVRVREMCERHADAGIGFVDAAVLAIVERMGESKVASFDHQHFDAVTPRHRAALTLLPDTSVGDAGGLRC